jgi:hypothetical protein
MPALQIAHNCGKTHHTRENRRYQKKRGGGDGEWVFFEPTFYTNAHLVAARWPGGGGGGGGAMCGEEADFFGVPFWNETPRTKSVRATHATSSRFAEWNEGKKEGRTNGRKEGRHARKEGGKNGWKDGRTKDNME